MSPGRTPPRRKSRPLALGTAALLAAAGALAAAPPAAATRAELPWAVVSLGDSYISGEGGRWYGNADGSGNIPGDRYGTDRAWDGSASGCTASGSGASTSLSCYRPRKVYPQTYMDRGLNYDPDNSEKGCDRSDVSEIRELAQRLDKGLKPGAAGYYRSFNLACSGAETKNIVKDRFKGQRLQLTDLGDYAAKNHIKLIVVSIGGNDMQFGPIAKTCGRAYLITGKKADCVGPKAAQLQAQLKVTQAGVTDVLKKIKTKMAAVDYDDYRIVLQSYPQFLAAANNNRYPASGLSPRARLRNGGCPFSNADTTAVRHWVTAFSDALRQAARAAGEDGGVNVDFLQLHQAFIGHEVCAAKSGKSAIVQADADHRATDGTSATMEWVRYATIGAERGWISGQGQQQESLHPNAYGQKAIGKCLHLLFAKASGQYTCKNTPGKDYEAMTVTRLQGTTK